MPKSAQFRLLALFCSLFGKNYEYNNNEYIRTTTDFPPDKTYKPCAHVQTNHFSYLRNIRQR